MGALIKQIDQFNKEGQPAAHVYAALDLLVEKGAPPSSLPALLVEAALVPREERFRKRLLQEHFERHGWPTGARWVRGSHSATFQYDPLGHDKVTEFDWEHPRPTRKEVGDLLMALHALGAFLTSVRAPV